MLEDLANIFNIFTIKIGTFFAGLFGATITLMKRSEGSVLSRLGGYLSAIFAIIYVVPAVVEFIRYLFGYTMPDVGEHILAFSFGMLANSIIESFLDDPSGSVKRWISNFKGIKKSLTNTPADSLFNANSDKEKLSPDEMNTGTKELSEVIENGTDK